MAMQATSGVISALSSNAQRKQLEKTAALQKVQGERQASAMAETASINARRAARNAHQEMAKARLDGASSGLAHSGTGYLREQDLATRLQDEIANSTNSALQDANLAREQSLLNSWNTQMEAHAAGINMWTGLANTATSMATTAFNYGLSSKANSSAVKKE